MKGFHNSLLRVDLTNGRFLERELEDSYLKNLGGKGLAVKLMHELIDPEVDPLSPQNKLIVGTGPATDTKLFGSGRHGIYTKSPLTGIFLESYSGGHLAPKIKRSGYDAIILEGRAKRPVYLTISDSRRSFCDAGSIWGKGSYEAEDLLLEETKDKNAGAMVIGPAGENEVKYAVITNDHYRQAGRGGAGAVMGSKNVKGIVFYGSKKAELADPERVEKITQRIFQKGQNNPAIDNYKKYGTTQLVSLVNEKGAFPVKYWSEESGTRKNYEKISGDYLVSEIKPSPRACSSCFIACSNFSKIVREDGEEITIEGPEYETIFSFGGLSGIERLEDVIYLNHLCNVYGIDTITAGNVISLVMHGADRGEVEQEISFGDVENAAKLLKEISYREGIGDCLAEGTVRASLKLDLKTGPVHAKNMEPPGYDPRALKGMALAYATGPRGADHLRATVYIPELTGVTNPDETEGKAELVVDYEDRHTLFDTLILCRFYRDLVPWPEIGNIIESLTGIAGDRGNLEEIAGRIADETRRLNRKFGVTKEDDTVSERLFEVASKNAKLTRDEVQKMVDDYYSVRGWK